MPAIVFTVQLDANNYAAAVDAKYGYPRIGQDIGGGIHASKAEGTTQTHAQVLKHPTLPQWAYMDAGPATIFIQKPVADVALPVTGSIQTLDATWFPAPVIL